MRQSPTQRHATPRHTSSRRTFIGSAAGFAVVAGAAVGGSVRAAHPRAQATPPAASGPPQGPTFVGPTSDPDALVAIVLPAGAPDAAFGYLCGGPQFNLWFTGSRDGDTLALAGPVPASASPEPGRTLSEPAPTLSATLTADGVTGEIALPDLTLSFTAIAAAGMAGLFEAERDAAGLIRGTSSTGDTLTARQSAATSGEAPFRINGTIVGADGGHYEVSIPAWTDDAAAVRWVVLADGEVRGGRRRRRGSEDEGDDFVDKIIEI